VNLKALPMLPRVESTRMKRRGLPCILAAVGLFFTVGDAAASSKPSEAELAAITTRGVLLAEYDTAAWQATDAARAWERVRSRAGAPVSGVF